MKKNAFSLVELLISLIIISLITAALLPIMTSKRKRDYISIGRNGVISYNSKFFTENSEWQVPNNVKNIKVTSIGAGGGGGGAGIGTKEFTSTQTWVVPQGVTKIKVYAVGAGGGGAQGIKGTPDIAATPGTPAATGEKFADMPAISLATGKVAPEIPSEGAVLVYTRESGTLKDMAIDGNSNYKTPAMTNGCTGNWTIVSTGAQIAPNTPMTSLLSGTNQLTITKIIACGGGGGGGGVITKTSTKNGSAGGSGGYVSKNVNINIATSNFSQISIKFGQGGKKGKQGDNSKNPPVSGKGGSGGSGLNSGDGGSNGGQGNTTGWGQSSGGGGGGGSTGVYDSFNLILEAPGGGGGAGAMSNGYGGGSDGNSGGKGGNGGGTGYGSGGAGGKVGAGGKGGDSGANGVKGVNKEAAKNNEYFNGSGGGGVGGKGGTGIGGVIPNSVFGPDYCSGGNKMTDGKPGAVQFTFSTPVVKNALKCSYPIPATSGTPAQPGTASKGGGGGGAGAVWVGEIDVTPGETLNFIIGTGGDSGANGGYTSIYRKGRAVFTAIGGNKGTGATGGAGGGFTTHVHTADGSARAINWLNINPVGGASGSNSSSAAGATGGGIYLKNNTFASGGSGKYGTGGNGGDASLAEAKAGKKGADGYIYIEYGEHNGGGGATGQIVQTGTLTVTPGDKIKVFVGSGGNFGSMYYNGIFKGSAGTNAGAGTNGGNSYIVIGENTYALAKGGYGGGGGALDMHGKGGKCDNSKFTCAYGKDGQNGFGGSGGSITQSMCSFYDAYKGLGGCGGNITSGLCFMPAATGIGKDAYYGSGAGGGGGAVNNGKAYDGGNGADGIVLIEWN